MFVASSYVCLKSCVRPIAHMYCPRRLWPRQCDKRGSVSGLDGHSDVRHCVHSGPGAPLDLAELPGDPSVGKAFVQCNQPLICSWTEGYEKLEVHIHSIIGLGHY